MSDLKSLTDFLDSLDKADIHYSLSSIREGAILVSVVVPGEHWEVEFMADGEVEVEIFESDGEILDQSAIKKLLKKHGK